MKNQKLHNLKEAAALHANCRRRQRQLGRTDGRTFASWKPGQQPLLLLFLLLLFMAHSRSGCSKAKKLVKK